MKPNGKCAAKYCRHDAAQGGFCHAHKGGAGKPDLTPTTRGNGGGDVFSGLLDALEQEESQLTARLAKIQTAKKAIAAL